MIRQLRYVLGTWSDKEQLIYGGSDLGASLHTREGRRQIFHAVQDT